MELMEWKSEYSVGSTRLDDDHRQLFGLINRLNEAMQERRGKEVIASVLANLHAYASRHFEAEEAVMRECAYPGLTRHCQEHRTFTVRVERLIDEYERGNKLISIDVLLLLRDWLDKHILSSDQGYAGYLKETLEGVPGACRQLSLR